MFVDHIKVHAHAGKGGDGSVHFYRGKFQPKGGPDGGDGGRGGSIILHVDNSTDSLKTFFFNSKLHAADGDPGAGKKCFGKSAKDVIYKVPPGTLISRWTEEEDPKPVKLKSLLNLSSISPRSANNSHCAKVARVAKATSTSNPQRTRPPASSPPGTPGEEGDFYFELRSIADAGFVGFPNAGKSTLMSKLSAARPKIASYPFTTLQPMVGVMEFNPTRRATIADIPGIIEGAHANIGLGHQFLRHIMRCRLLMFVVDTAGSEARDPITDLEILRTEISLYSDELAKRPWCIIANKMDLPGAEDNLALIKERFKRVKVHPISADSGLGISKLHKYLDQKIGHDTE